MNHNKINQRRRTILQYTVCTFAVVCEPSLSVKPPSASQWSPSVEPHTMAQDGSGNNNIKCTENLFQRPSLREYINTRAATYAMYYLIAGKFVKHSIWWIAEKHHWQVFNLVFILLWMESEKLILAVLLLAFCPNLPNCEISPSPKFSRYIW